MKAYICSFPGCFAPVDCPRTYCLKHAGQATRKPAPKPWAGAARPNDALYNTSRWRTLRARVLKENPNCAQCGSSEGLTVHHANLPKGNEEAFFDPEALIVLCKECHDRITSAENRRKAR